MWDKPAVTSENGPGQAASGARRRLLREPFAAEQGSGKQGPKIPFLGASSAPAVIKSQTVETIQARAQAHTTVSSSQRQQDVHSESFR